ncbi:PTS sugar transporter subunit IIA [Spiroplasma sp. DGKH1]|uniref:PTS sugar transporter subunit IIA n=1 Tax=Spiroplasma sp. DGKH1 TaxID=3050074 RepID=UPI0034C5D347
MQIDFLESLVTNNSIVLHQTAANWETAVQIVFKPLLASKAISEEYIDNVIKKTKALGPYYIIAPKLAMPHTRPEEGALKNAFSLISLTKPVLFAENQPVSLLIGFCAVDAETHLSLALPQIAAIFENPVVIEQIIQANSPTEVINIIKKIDYMKYVK